MQTDEKIKTQNLSNVRFEKIIIFFRKEQQYLINIYFSGNLKHIKKVLSNMHIKIKIRF